MKVYLVIQHQSDSEYDNEVINVVDSEEKAQKLCIEYNTEYAQNVELKNGFVVKVLNLGVYHFYTYKSIDVE